MVSVTLGEHELALTRPDDLADRVLASTGLGIEEARSVLLVPAPALLTSALHPLTDCSMEPADMGEALAAADMLAVIEALVPFYAEEQLNAGE